MQEDQGLRSAIRAYAATADGALSADQIVAAVTRPPRRAWLRTVALVAVLAVVAITVLLGARVLVGSSPGIDPVASCDGVSWPATSISCADAEASVSWGDVRIDRVRIWLTTLGAIKSTMNPQQQVIEPALDTPVWLFVYDGRWTCCLHADQSGRLVGPTDQSRWILAVDATEVLGAQTPAGRVGTGAGYVYLLEWSGRAVPDRLPRPAAVP